LHAAADLLVERVDELIEANATDVARAEESSASPTIVDRLRLSPSRVEAMADGLRKVAGLPDPVGEIADGWVRPNGLRVRRVRVPLGVVAIVYENRPNVTSDAAGLCVKSGNAAFLRGSSGAISSNIAVAGALRDGFVKAGLPDDSVILVEDTSHEAAIEFMRLRGVIDCLIPRGGPSLIGSVLEHATVPYVIDGDGNCHVYVHADADLEMARRIAYNAKVQRPGVCNAAETLLVNADVAGEFLPGVLADLRAAGVELVGDERARGAAAGAPVGQATAEDWDTEYLDLRMTVGVVDSLEAAIEHVNGHGTGHSEAIVTASDEAAAAFTQGVDAACVYVNASTRFTDGFEFGMGAEIGNSTQKLHARGPIGLRELTTTKYVLHGTGQVRS
jgi:glutamate-5-semialdehyde dehydrogenase